MTRFRRRSVVSQLPWFVLLIILAGPRWGIAEEPSAAGRIDPRGISGSLVIVGGGELPESAAKHFVSLAGGENAKLIIVPTAQSQPENLKAEALAKRWNNLGISSVTVLHAQSREEASDAKLVAPLKEATAVWFLGGQQSRLAAAYQGTAFEAELKKLLNRGGVIGGTSAGAAIQTRVMIASGQSEPDIQTGLDLLPGAIIDQHFTQRNRQPRLRLAVKQHPECVGLGIDEGTALIVGTNAGRSSPADRGRTISVVGSGEVTVILAASAHKPMREYRVKEGRLLDLTQLRRAARDRLANFPAASAGVPDVPNGSLVIVGGGGMPDEIVAKILELAGGPDAKIVVLPTANTPERADREGKPSYFVKAGAKKITVLKAQGPEELSRPEAIQALKEADCVWFGGGRQWRFVDAYAGTPALELFHDVLRRGGVIAGSSAGASIQGEYLARADAITNRLIMAEGYERGFNFLPGTAIDQHFTQRKRFNDLGRLVSTYPQYLGIGIDEATAIVVRGQVAEVIGRNRVHFFNANETSDDTPVPYESLSAGTLYDLANRQRLRPAIAEKPAR